MNIDEVRYAGYECLRLRSTGIELVAATSAGPRIIDVRRRAADNMLASLPEANIGRLGEEPFRFIGGHRLWAAPEVPAITYAPDDAPVEVSIAGGSVTLMAPPDSAALGKTMTIMLHATSVTIVHTITNHGVSRSLAPWAITQLVPGGTAMIPLGSTTTDPYQAWASVVAWPYSDWNDPLVRIEKDHIEITAQRIDPIKFGTALHRGWLAYKLGEDLFVKRATPTAGPHTDLGATGQCYAIESFIELETLGPLATLGEGGCTTHTETWELHEVDPTAPITDIAADLELDAPNR